MGLFSFCAPGELFSFFPGILKEYLLFFSEKDDNPIRLCYNTFHQGFLQGGNPMKKLLSLVLALMMMLSAIPGLAEAALIDEPSNGLPQVGDVVNGFEVLEIRPFSLIGADVVLFEHQQTGAKLMYIANDDTNRAFQLSFLTRATDNTGLPHVFEHATLSGSDKYPSTALFMNLLYQTYNTYMNAYTASCFTAYPIASLSEAQLLKLADYYTDSCLHPLILEKESIYRTEAWRYRLASLDDDLTIEGTVYSEMQGSLTLTGMAGYNAARAAFPGSVTGNISGGDPDYIPDMTWDSLKEFHSQFYHPSNCIAFLYGQFEDYTAFLALLDEAFAPYEKSEFVFEDSGYTPITEPVEMSVPFPMEEGTNTENQSMIYLEYVCPGLQDDLQEELVLNTLTDLMISSSSPVMQKLKKALPTGQFGTYIDTDGPDDAIVFYAMNVNENDGPLFKATVDEALAEIAENGFAQDMVDSVMASVNMDNKLASAESTDPVEGIIYSIAYSYSTSGDPFNYMDYVDGLSKMDEWNQQGLYKDAVSKWLLGSQLTALVTTYPAPGLKNEKDAALAAQLAELKAGMTEEELQAIIDATNAPAEEDDASALIAQLQAVTTESLPEEVKLYDVLDETDENGIRHIEAIAGVDGVGTADIYLDAQALPQEDLHWFRLFTRMMGQLDTDAHTKKELDTLIARYLYGCTIGIDPFVEEDGSIHPYLILEWTAMDEDLDEGYALMEELIFHTQYTDTDKLLEQVQAQKASVRSTINGNAYSVMLYRGLAKDVPLYRFYSYINFLDYYAFLENLEVQLQENPEEVTAHFEAIQAFFANSYGAISTYAGNEESIALNRGLADEFLGKLASEEREAAVYDLPIPAEREALIIDGNIQYNCVIASFDGLGLEDYDASLDVIASLVSDQLLVPILRDGYGVYTPWTGAISDGGFYLITYRDPNIAETFEVYAALPELVSEIEVDQETLDGYILSNYSGLAQGSGELSGALGAISYALQGESQELPLEYMRQLKAVTPEAVRAAADLYQKAWDNGVHSTAGSASLINAYADLYDVILNPFNAQDASAVELVDVPEGSDYYDVVRFAFESAMMAPKTEDTFGVEDPATVSDFLAALYCGMGGGPNAAEEAFEYFAGYGLISPDLDLSAELTEDAMCGLLGNLGVPIETDTPEAVVIRGDLADILYWLFAAE